MIANSHTCGKSMGDDFLSTMGCMIKQRRKFSHFVRDQKKDTEHKGVYPSTLITFRAQTEYLKKECFVQGNYSLNSNTDHELRDQFKSSDRILKKKSVLYEAYTASPPVLTLNGSVSELIQDALFEAEIN